MSLLPILFSNWWEDLDRPHRITDQYFGQPLTASDLLHSALTPAEREVLVLGPSRRLHSHRHYHPYERSLIGRRSGGVSTVHADKDKFRVNLDVQHFNPDEVNVKVVDRNIVVEGKHEEKQDEHGYISRQFVRKYLVPEQCDIDKLAANLSSDGVLSIEAPRKPEPKEATNERVIPIQKTGVPAISEQAESGSSEQRNKSQQKSVPVEKKSKSVKAA